MGYNRFKRRDLIILKHAREVYNQGDIYYRGKGARRLFRCPGSFSLLIIERLGGRGERERAISARWKSLNNAENVFPSLLKTRFSRFMFAYSIGNRMLIQEFSDG